MEEGRQRGWEEAGAELEQERAELADATAAAEQAGLEAVAEQAAARFDNMRMEQQLQGAQQGLQQLALIQQTAGNQPLAPVAAVLSATAAAVTGADTPLQPARSLAVAGSSFDDLLEQAGLVQQGTPKGGLSMLDEPGMQEVSSAGEPGAQVSRPTAESLIDCHPQQQTGEAVAGCCFVRVYAAGLLSRTDVVPDCARLPLSAHTNAT